MDYVEKFRKGEKPTLAFIKAAISDPSDDSAREGFATIAESLIIATWVQEVAIPSLIMCKTFDEVSDKHKHPLGGHAKQLLDSLNTLLEGTNAGKGMCLGEQRDDGWTFEDGNYKYKGMCLGEQRDDGWTFEDGNYKYKGMCLGEQRDDTEPDFEFSFLHDMTNGIGMILPFEDKGGTPC